MSEYISTTEAADILGVSRVTVFNMIKDGRIKRAIKVGRNYIIPKDFQLDFIAYYAEKIIPILKKNGIKRAAIFGSTACGARRKNSDLDLLYEYDKKAKKSLFCLAGLKNELEDLLNIKVDLVGYNYIHPLIKDAIMNHKVEIL